MLSWVITFLIIALIVGGVLRFGGVTAIGIAKAIAVILFLVSAVLGLARGRTRV